MKIAFIGIGYVGLTSGVCFAELGNSVICVDNVEEKIEKLKKLQMPFYEPGLKEIVERNIKSGSLKLTTSMKEAVESSDIIFLAVGTPQSEDGSTDLSYTHNAAKEISQYINKEKFIITKSTVPVGTTESLKKFFENCQHKVHLISNPEFLAEGMAVKTFMSADRIVVGVQDKESETIIRELYKVFTDKGIPLLITNPSSSELIKYASNAMLATRVSFINEIANLCEIVKANIDDVSKGIGLDPRIGSKFLRPGIGFGGSCFPKDVESLIFQSNKLNSKLKVLSEVNTVNAQQKELIVKKIKKHFENLEGKTFAIWGLSFKPDTDDIREAPSLVIIEKLLEAGAKLNVHDPEAMHHIKKVFEDRISYKNSRDETLENADALILITEWDIYRAPDLEKLKNLKDKVIFDGRNVLDKNKLIQEGFTYYGIGR